MLKVNFGKHLNPLLFVSFSIGIILGRQHPDPFIFYIFTLAAIILIFVLNRSRRYLFLDLIFLMAFIFLGALWQISSFTSYSKIDNFLGQDNRLVLSVATLPKDAGARHVFDGQVNKINSYNVEKKIKVRVIDYTKTLEYLNTYEITGKLTKREYHGRAYYYFWVRKKNQPVELPIGFWSKIRKRIIYHILDIYETNCNLISHNFLSAIFLGRKELINDQRLAFSQAGVSHLLAISGLHIGLFSLIIFFVIRFFNINFRVRLVISLLILYIYIFLTDISPSTMRAVIMYSIFSISFFLKRKYNALNSLAFAGIIALLIDPQSLFDVGFQLSFVSVFSIIMSFRMLNMKPADNPILNYLRQLLFCSFFVTLALTPLVSHYFGKIHILSIFYNLILIPIFTFILGVNFLLIVFSPVGFLSQSLGASLSLIIPLFIKLVDFLGSFRFAYLTYYFSSAEMIIYYILFLAAGTVFLFSGSKKYRPEVKK